MTNYFGGFGQKHVARRTAETLSGSLGDDEQRCRVPIAGPGQTWYYHQIQKVAERGDGPIGARAIGELSGKVAQAGRDHLSQTGNNADLGSGGPEVLEEWTDDAVGPFISHVGEKADKPEADYEAK